MVQDAETHAEEDKSRREEAEIRNNADNLVYQTEKMLTDQAENISEEEKSTVQEKLTELKTLLDSDDTEAIKNATEALMSASQEFGQRIYESTAQENSEAQSAENDDVVDAEIVDEQ
jgi:molecular chaperone DnaK